MTYVGPPEPYGSCDKEDRPVIILHPGRVGGNPTIGHTRLSAQLVAATYWHYGRNEVIAMYPELTDLDVITCCWYVANHGSRTEQERFKGWKHKANEALWHMDPEAHGLVWPPTKN